MSGLGRHILMGGKIAPWQRFTSRNPRQQVGKLVAIELPRKGLRMAVALPTCFRGFLHDLASGYRRLLHPLGFARVLAASFFVGRSALAAGSFLDALLENLAALPAADFVAVGSLQPFAPAPMKKSRGIYRAVWEDAYACRLSSAVSIE